MENERDEALVAYLAGDVTAAADQLSNDERADIDALNRLLADPSLWAEPPPDLEDRVLQAIYADRSGAILDAPSTHEPTAPPEPAAPSEATPAHGVAGLDGGGPLSSAPIGDLAAARSRHAARRGSRWRRPGVLVAAAATAVAVAIGAFLMIRAVNTEPPFTAALAATDLAPGADGSATMTRTDSGWEIRLRATGLPRLDNGSYYEAWLKNSDGILVSIGTFNEGTDVTLWAGVSPAAFGTMTVTIELADGNQASSGKRVLVGTATAP